MDFEKARNQMVKLQLESRGITDPRVLAAFRKVPREEFLPSDLKEFAYEDAPLPIGDGQTISQPYIVALTVESLGLQPDDRVLEIGTGSGYAAAILSQIAKEVFTVERIDVLATESTERLRRLGYSNVRVLCGDGTLGWPDHAPFDAIAIAAGGPRVPNALTEQLTLGGRLVIPVGPEDMQVLTRVTRDSFSDYSIEQITEVRFVPLIGQQGWPEAPIYRPPGRILRTGTIARLLRETVEPLDDLESASVDALVDRAGNSKLVLLGEASHGTSEFYRLRARITKELITKKGFDFVGVEADWPDAARIDNYVIGDSPRSTHVFVPFARFPTWMWRNREVNDFVSWLRAHNAEQRDPRARVGFHGLDLYSMFTSIAAVLAYLDNVDPAAARVARARYAALTPWQKNPAEYGRAVLVGEYSSSETAVVSMLREMLERRLEYARMDGDRFFDAAQNATVVANAERYYRAMYYGAAASWNLRDNHMFDTLKSLRAYYGPEARGVIWEHNSHIGDALATEMSARGELNVGQLCRTEFGDDAYLVGFGTDHGTVAAASNWDGPMHRMRVRPSHPESYEYLCHDTEVPAFFLHLREPTRKAVRDELSPPLLERAIGVIYRPETELQSHYFQASLPRQFDEYIWIDETSAVTPLEATPPMSRGLPETYPFGL